MARATFLWDDENIAHVARHGITTAECERIVNDPRNVEDRSDSTGRPIRFGSTKAGRYLAVVYEQRQDEPWTVRVTTAYDVEQAPEAEVMGWGR